ncbi:MAG: zf-TFIIB domain-containing protein [Verrucomicrobiota bacterium]
MQETWLTCPNCGAGLLGREREGIRLEACPACHGVWAGTTAWHRIQLRQPCDTTDHPAWVLPDAPPPTVEAPEAIRYRPCPCCGERMNRVHAGAGSGVVIDCCRPHGTWFDAGELARVREAVRSGAWEQARMRAAGRVRSSGVPSAPRPGVGLDATPLSEQIRDGWDVIEVVVEVAAILLDG